MKVKELFTDESKWTTGLNARDEDNYHAAPRSDTAVKWCLMGAIIKCYENNWVPTQNIVRARLNGENIATWNDSHQFEDVKRLAEELDI